MPNQVQTAPDYKTRELAAWHAATDAHALAPTDPETKRIIRESGEAIDATHNQPGGYYSPAAYEARAAIWAKLARTLTARRFDSQVNPARTAKARADEAIRAHYAAGKTAHDYARTIYRAALENLALAESDARDACAAYDSATRARAATNLPRTAEAARVQFEETISNL